MKKEHKQVIIAIAAVTAAYLGYRYFTKQKAATNNAVLGNVATAAPAAGIGAPTGYGYDPSRNVYTWIGYGAPPDGKWTIPLI
jgi:hypothetical protein